MRVRDGLSNISDAVEYLSVEIENELSKNVILSLDRRTPNCGFPKICDKISQYTKKFLLKNQFFMFLAP